MQTIIDCHTTTNANALTDALERFQGQGGRATRQDDEAGPKLLVEADGAMIETTTWFSQGWVMSDQQTATGKIG